MRALALTCLGAALAAGGCATTSQRSASPNYAAISTQVAPPNGRLYAECLAEAVGANRYRAAGDGDGAELLLFTCAGAPANALFEALGPWSAQIGSQVQSGEQTLRSTAPVQADLFGVDYCVRPEPGAPPTCTLTFNAGDFLDFSPAGR